MEVVDEFYKYKTLVITDQFYNTNNGIINNMTLTHGHTLQRRLFFSF